MKAEEFPFNKSCNREVIEEISQIFPYILVAVLSLTLIIETVDLGDLSAFMIASQNGYSAAVTNLVCKKKTHSLN
eukprot:CAMPEP_0114595130 /NCGR_PEP_ID=MMETSP0125-20121206/16874_1 /TAXON_ID=485358 ORGANISM="Aristerostoma sp., Strain ATCC 50986" /NCGR_SAMPLE_ID=MMETSP0125 /ASSEMBLY_ACC=CAM_ASM_000245 /LENGTH=74 /DNA_ID=CAMNT_0001796301 /DNA_START=493 /DNA_END=717 /DNA_ORIENTATION=+